MAATSNSSFLFLITFMAALSSPMSATHILNVSHAFHFSANTSSVHNFSSLALPLYYTSATNKSSFLINALIKEQNATSSSKARAAPRVSFTYNDVTLMTEVMVGTPPQKKKMVLDTGSELSWLQCKPGSRSSFNPTLSSSYKTLPCKSSLCTAPTKDFPAPTSCDSKRLCHFVYTYADGTDIEGNLARDSITLPTLTIPGFIFGCSPSASIPETPGLMGLNRGALSFISQVNKTHKFSYCITGSSFSAGVIVFGDSPFSKYLHYTPLLRISLPLPYFDRTAYTVRLKGIMVGKKLLPIPESVFLPDHTGAGQTMIDSGTQFTLLLGQAYGPLKQEFVRQNRRRLSPMGGNFVFRGVLDLCYNLPAGAAQLPKVSPVTLLFDSVKFSLHTHQLLYPVPESQGGPISKGGPIYCFTFGNSDLAAVEANIIGNHHQQNLWIEYDLQNSRIGFARARCNAN